MSPVIPFPAAGATDYAARAVGGGVAEPWGQAVVFDNRAGAGRTLLLIDNIASSPLLLESGKLRALAALLPDVPTSAQCGYPAFPVSQWYGLFAPAGMPVANARQMVQAARAWAAQGVVPEFRLSRPLPLRLSRGRGNLRGIRAARDVTCSASTFPL